MKSTFTRASKSEAFKLLYSLNWKSGFNKPYFVFRKRKNGKYRNKFLKNIEISFKEMLFENCNGVVMIIEDLIKNEIVTSRFLKRNISRIEKKDIRFNLNNLDDLYSESFYQYSDVDPINTSNKAYFKNGEDTPFDMDFLFFNGDLYFSSYPVGDEFLNVLNDSEVHYLKDIENFHLEYWDKKLNVANNPYLKLVNNEK